MKNFYLIGLTGNLGSGKSTVRRMLEEQGAFGIDADKLGHVAMMRGTLAWDAIVQAFGTDVLLFSGKINRRKLGALVFRDPDALGQLESILHPAVGELIKQSLRETTASVVVLEAIKLVEAGLNLWCDALWVVTASQKVQLERVMRDRHMSAQDAQARLTAQGAMDEKLVLANVIIDNSYDLAATRLQVENAWKNTVHPEHGREKDAWLFSFPGQRPRDIEPLPAPDSAPAQAETRTESQAPESTPPTSAPSEPGAEKALQRHESSDQVEIASEDTEHSPIDKQAAPLAAEVSLSTVLAPVAIAVVQESVLSSPQANPVVTADELAAPAAIPFVPEPASPPVLDIDVQEEAPAAPPFIAPSEPQPQPQTPDKTDVSIVARRARRTDLEALGAALAKMEGRTSELGGVELIKRLGERGYWIAVAGDRIVALASWEAENLVATAQGLWVESPELAPQALTPLLTLIGQDALALQCEVLIVLLDKQVPFFVLDLVRAAGFEPRSLASLHRLWRQAAEERSRPGDLIWIRVLREGITTKPL